MKICIVGAGVVGSFVAQTLARGNYNSKKSDYLYCLRIN